MKTVPSTHLALPHDTLGSCLSNALPRHSGTHVDVHWMIKRSFVATRFAYRVSYGTRRCKDCRCQFSSECIQGHFYSRRIKNIIHPTLQTHARVDHQRQLQSMNGDI
ncbi:hypothetical protein SprV_0802525800 [Sparganum proliferum]